MGETTYFDIVHVKNTKILNIYEIYSYLSKRTTKYSNMIKFMKSSVSLTLMCTDNVISPWTHQLLEFHQPLLNPLATRIPLADRPTGSLAIEPNESVMRLISTQILSYQMMFLSLHLNIDRFHIFYRIDFLHMNIIYGYSNKKITIFI